MVCSANPEIEADPRDHASGVVNFVLATRNAWSRVKRLLGNARVFPNNLLLLPDKPAGGASIIRIAEIEAVFVDQPRATCYIIYFRSPCTRGEIGIHARFRS